MKKWIITFIAIITSLSLNICGVVFAQTPTPAPSNTPAAKTDKIVAPTEFNLSTMRVGNKQDAQFAGILGGTKPKADTNPVGALIIRIINFIIYTIGSLAFLVVVAGGVLMISANGDSARINKAKEYIQFAAMGLIVAFSAFFIVAFVQSLLFEIK